MIKTSIDKARIRHLLLEGIRPSAVKVLQAAGNTQIESLTDALVGDEVNARTADVHFVGIRSRTKLTAEVVAHAPTLVALAAFASAPIRWTCRRRASAASWCLTHRFPTHGR